MSLDATDRHLLRLLQVDARLTHKELAAATGLSVTPVYERVKRLERNGFIHGYVALANRHALGLGLLAFCMVRLAQHRLDLVQQFEAAVIQLPEVVTCHHLTGNFDYLLQVVATDMPAYQDFLVNRLATIPDIGQVQSAFVLTEVKAQTAWPV